MQEKKIMASVTAEDGYIWGEDLDIIMHLIEEGVFEDEDFNKEVSGAVDEVISVEETFACDLC